MSTPLGPDGLTLVEGSTFCLSDVSGDIISGHAQGLFVRDVRTVSRWELTVDGLSGELLWSGVEEPFAASVLLHLPGDRGGPRPGSLLLVRRRYVGEGMREDLILRNGTARAATCHVCLAVGTDFADLFAVKDGRPHGLASTAVVRPGVLALSAREHGHALTVSADGDPQAHDGGLCWEAHVPARGEWVVSVAVEAMIAGRRLALHHPRGSDVTRSHPARRLDAWRNSAPGLETADADLAALLRRSVEDLGALRIFDPAHPERAVVAAGAPWFMALFGRDSLLTSLMLLPLDRGLALGTLQTLAAYQGTVGDPATEEQPGRIVHELRFGPPSPFAPGERDRYYGTADATALFVIVLDELARWGAPTEAVAALLPHADRALAWIDQYGDLDGDGFVEYRRATSRGLLHQGWKDSIDGINFADGRLAEPPIALIEVQAYTYAALLARAHLADAFTDPVTALRCRARAAELRERFHARFWLPDRGRFAIALDADKRPVDALASNAGHALWAGIVDEALAPSVAANLVAPEMFSGWGVRTLAASMGAYDPMSYHNGSVWPHDTALCIAGLARYGFLDEARRLSVALLRASAAFSHRLPELFGGFDRTDSARPLPYPTSCAPQAWAAAAPVLVLRALMRLEPDATRGTVRCDPALPAELVPLRVRTIRIGSALVDVSVNESGWSLAGLEGTGLRLERTT